MKKEKYYSPSKFVNYWGDIYIDKTHTAYQENLDNIQFLSKDEHLEVHKGNWHTSTNRYYNPTTKQFKDFCEDMYIPCQVIELSHPITTIVN